MRHILRLAYFLPVLLAGVILAGTDLHAQMWYSARTFGGVNTETPQSVGRDAAGNIYVAGTFSRTTIIGIDTLRNGNFTGLFVAKFNAAGTPIWAVAGTGTGDYSNTTLAVDRQGNCYVAGAFTRTAYLGNQVLNSAGNTDIFVTKCDSSGNFLWAHRSGQLLDESARSIAVDSSGGIYVTGHFRSLITLGNFNRIGEAGLNVFVAKFNDKGITQWITACGGTGNEAGYGIAADASGNTYVTGEFSGKPEFGPFNLVSKGSSDIFVMKLLPNGEIFWVSEAGGPTAERGQDITVDRFGNAYILTNISNSFPLVGVTFRRPSGDTVVSATGGVDVAIVKYDQYGDVQWVRVDGGVGTESGVDITVDGAGSCYATGRFDGNFTNYSFFGDTQLFETGPGDAFVVSYDSAGDFKWAISGGGSEWDQGIGLQVEGPDQLVVVGEFSYSITFGDIVRTGTTSQDFFIARIGVTPVITTGSFPAGPYCPDSAIAIPFTVSRSFYKNNVFTAQISDASGNFNPGMSLGVFAGVRGDTIRTRIPASLRGGDNYRIRVVSSAPPTIYLIDRGIKLGGGVSPVITALDTLVFCAGDSVELDAGDGYASYNWSNGAMTRKILVRDAGSYSVSVANAAGCTGTSAPVQVINKPVPVKPVIVLVERMLESTEATTYEWLLDDTVIPGATSRLFHVDKMGVYKVRVTNAEGCGAESDPMTVAISGVEQADAADGGLRIYPQPTAGAFTVELGSGVSGEVRVVVRDGVGREVLRTTERSQGGAFGYSADLSGLPAGVYYVEVESGARRWTGQVLKR